MDVTMNNTKYIFCNKNVTIIKTKMYKKKIILSMKVMNIVKFRNTMRNPCEYSYIKNYKVSIRKKNNYKQLINNININ